MDHIIYMVHPSNDFSPCISDQKKWYSRIGAYKKTHTRDDEVDNQHGQKNEKVLGIYSTRSVGISGQVTLTGGGSSDREICQDILL